VPVTLPAPGGLAVSVPVGAGDGVVSSFFVVQAPSATLAASKTLNAAEVFFNGVTPSSRLQLSDDAPATQRGRNIAVYGITNQPSIKSKNKPNSKNSPKIKKREPNGSRPDGMIF
jgi:hypothetical protein